MNSKASKVIFMKSTIAALATALVLLGCGKSGDKTATVPADGMEVKIGHVAPLTGPICSLG